MKKRLKSSNLILISAIGGGIFLAGCANMETGNDNTKSLLATAGFRVRSPETAKQREVFAALPSNRVEHAKVHGKSFYVFKDEKAGVAYVGGEADHRRYLELCRQRHAAKAQEEEMNPSLATSWDNQWGARQL